MSNTHAIADTAYELQATCEDLLPACVISTTWPTVPVSSMTLAAFATQAYVRDGQALVYCDQPAITLPLSGSAGTYWLAITRDVSTAYATWTRRPGSQYLWQLAGARPPDVDGLLVFASVTVAGGVITAVTPASGVTRAERWRTLAALGTMATQNAASVAITGGTVTGLTQLAVGTTTPTVPVELVVTTPSTDFTTTVMGLRVRPGVPSGTLDVQHIRLEPVNFGGGATMGNWRGLLVIDPGQASTMAAYGVDLRVNMGIGSRWNIYASGTAPNYFAGQLYIGGGAVNFNNQAAIFYPKNSVNGLLVRPTDNDAGPGVILNFHNVAGTPIGTITGTSASVAYNTTSDVRLKHAIATLTGALDVVAALRPKQFRWNADDSPGVGYLAHELQQVVPEAVTGEPDEVNPDGSIKPQGVDHSRLVPWLTAALQEAVAQLAALTARVASLEEALGV